MYDNGGLGALTPLEEQARADAAEMEARMLATLRSGKFAAPSGGVYELPEITVRASPLPMMILLAVILFFAFGERKGLL